jgi:hypothetical protein
MQVDSALGPVGKRFDDAAVADPAACALLEHAFELALEHCQPAQPLLDLLKLAPGKSIDSIAGLVRAIRQAEQLADRIERETEVTAMADESEAVDVLSPVATLVAGSACGLRHEPDLLVIADRLHLAAGCVREIANPDFLARHAIAPLNLQVL